MSFIKNNVCNTNIIGPYRYTYSGNQFFQNTCGCSTSSCGCKSICDISYEFDYGTKSIVEVDWSSKLKKENACKIMSSKWFIKKEASEPLRFSNENFSNDYASIMIDGGVHAGKYVLVNEITTEMDTSLRCCVCINLVGDYTTLTPIGESIQNCEIPIETSEDIECVTQGIVENGVFTLKDFCERDICKIKFTLISGSAKIIDKEIYDLSDTSTCVTIENKQGIESFCLTVDADSKILYELETL